MMTGQGHNVLAAHSAETDPRASTGSTIVDQVAGFIFVQNSQDSQTGIRMTLKTSNLKHKELNIYCDCCPEAFKFFAETGVSMMHV